MRSNVTLTPESREETFIEHYHAPTAEAEAEFVVMKIEELLGGISHFSINSGRGGKSESTISFRDIGVLYRLSHQAVYLIEAFERRGIPFQIVGVPPFYMTSDIRAAYYWVRAASDTSAPEHLNLLKHIQGIGATTHDKIEKELPVAFTDFWKTLENVKLPSKMQKRLNNVFHNLERFKNEAKKNGLAQALRESMSYLSLNPDSAAYQRFLELAGAFGKDLYAFSHHLELNAASTAYDDRAEAVSLMTLHAAKGLEFHAVFITGLEEGLLPCAIESRKTDVEEERRLFYVGLTRAQENLFLTSSAKRNIYGKTDEQRISRFIKEIPSRFIVKSYPGKRVKKPLKTQLKLF
jgi:DNA helicase-2/ATP-dependent DNA helicase PcrA